MSLLLSALAAAQTSRPFAYPPSKTVDVVDDYHGVKVADPYRWLEDQNSADVKAWVDAQNRLTFDYLGHIPARAVIQQRLTRLWNYERFGLPIQRGGRYFWTRNSGLQRQAVLYIAESLTAEPRVLLDPNTLSADGTVALAVWAPSEDGAWLAYAASSAGSDWMECRIRNVATGQDLPDHLEWLKFSTLAWTHDAKGFYYCRYDEPPKGQAYQASNYFQKVYYHRLNTSQADDALVYERPDRKQWMFSPQVTDDGRYLVVTIEESSDPKKRVYFLDLQGPDRELRPLLDDFDAMYEFLDNDGPVFWFRTDNAAPRGRVIAVDTRRPQREHWQELIPQAAATLTAVSVVGQRFVATYLEDAHSRIRFFDLQGRPAGELALEGIGSAGGFPGRRGDRETFYSFTSFTVPARVYRYDFDAGQSSVFKQPRVDFDPREYETTEVFYTCRGARVPIFITQRKGLLRDGNNPTHLYGYGGFDISITPYFSPANVVWMELGGVCAVACIHGGGEYGKEWHDAGRLKEKQRCFDDFIAAAEYLIVEKYTRSARLAISGASNGGLLVGACVTQRPELFGAALPAVGVMDMLRFHKFTIGWSWVSDYGCADDPEMFKVLRAYSPLQNIHSGTSYPAMLITTGDHDDRVVPAHSFKFAAAMQATQAGDKPILIRIETSAGHGAGKPVNKVLEEQADRWAFLVRTLNVDASAFIARTAQTRPE